MSVLITVTFYFQESLKECLCNNHGLPFRIISYFYINNHYKCFQHSFMHFSEVSHVAYKINYNNYHLLIPKLNQYK